MFDSSNVRSAHGQGTAMTQLVTTPDVPPTDSAPESGIGPRLIEHCPSCGSHLEPAALDVTQSGNQHPGRRLNMRFLLVDLLPIATFAVIMLILLGMGVPAHAPDPQRLTEQAGRVGTGQAIVVGFVFFAVVALAWPFQIGIVRLLEGYWGASAIGSALASLGIELQRRRVKRLTGLLRRPANSAQRERLRQVAAERLATYPLDDRDLLPTRLGNVLRAAETRAGQRYGLDTLTVWPRLYPHLSDSVTEALADLRDQLDTAARLCAVLALATIISAALLAVHGWWLLIPATTAMLSWIAYRAAIRAADDYGEQLYVAFDLHRFDMLRGLHLPLPYDPDLELQLNERLSGFFRGRGNLNANEVDFVTAYAHGDQPTTAKRANRPLLLGSGRRALSWRRRIRPPRPPGSEKAENV